MKVIENENEHQVEIKVKCSFCDSLLLVDLEKDVYTVSHDRDDSYVWVCPCCKNINDLVLDPYLNEML